jgi:hypothetical protein
MSGPVWATLAGVGFGLFQGLNRQAIRGMDVWRSTFMQVLVSTLILPAGTRAPPGRRGPGRSRLGIGRTLAGWRGSLPGLGTAACWAVSPLLIRQGLRSVPAPLLGVTISMFGATLPQSVVVVARRRLGLSQPIVWDATAMKLGAAVLVGLSTWTRWIALDRSPVAVVLALGLLSVPTVMLVAPALAGRHEELVTRGVWLGATLVAAATLVLVCIDSGGLGR